MANGTRSKEIISGWVRTGLTIASALGAMMIVYTSLVTKFTVVVEQQKVQQKTIQTNAIRIHDLEESRIPNSVERSRLSWVINNINETLERMDNRLRNLENPRRGKQDLSR